MATQDRLTLLLGQGQPAPGEPEPDPPIQPKVTGIDFIQVVDSTDQTVLRVFFLINPDELDNPFVTTSAMPVQVATDLVTIVSTSGGERLAQVPVIRATFLQVVQDSQSRTILEIQTQQPGDFSIYRLTIVDDQHRIDRFFNDTEFSFKQGCPSVLDCLVADPDCPADDLEDTSIDYLARDFVSLRGALLDFAAHRHPQWTEQITADTGVMLAEVMAALGDELSYVQDRYAREAHLETASQRHSIRQHARLVDYQLHDGLSAHTLLDLTVSDSAGAGSGGDFVTAGNRVWAPCPGQPAITFELGTGLADTVADNGNPLRYWVHQRWNRISAHVPDPGAPCLLVGATELFLVGKYPEVFQLPGDFPPGDDPSRFWIGRWLLLRTDPADRSLSARRYFVRIEQIEHTIDPLVSDGATPSSPVTITRIRWSADQALPFEMCLNDLTVHANIVPAIAGQTYVDYFGIGEGAGEGAPDSTPVRRAVERAGALDATTCDRSLTLLYSLREAEAHGLGWTGQLGAARPELELQEVDPNTLDPLTRPQLWQWQQSRLDSRAHEDKFSLVDGTWRRIIGFRRGGETIEHQDYAGNAGVTIRFGDGEFGRIPPNGTVFRARYRGGPGLDANLPADTVVRLFDPDDATTSDLSTVLDSATNPLPVNSAVDPESIEDAKVLAPEQFRAHVLYAVRPQDYAQIAERALPWVQRVGARARWTGSWLSHFVTADPRNAFELSASRRTELENLLDCVRQAGREVFLRAPRYQNIDLEVTICVAASAYRGQVIARVLEALVGRTGARPMLGFFHPDNFTFGTALRRSALEATIQRVAGVLAVESIRIRSRGITDWQELSPLDYAVADDRVIRLQNDPRFPERGSLSVNTRSSDTQLLEAL